MDQRRDATRVGGTGDTSNMRSNIRYCKGHGWQVLAGVDVPDTEIRACSRCVVKR